MARSRLGIRTTIDSLPNQRGQRGQSVVELALITPMLLLIFLGVVDFSRLYHDYVAATNAARVGAEAAMPWNVPNANVIAAVENEAAPTVQLTNVVISPTVRTAGTPVEIGVSYVFTAYTPLVSSLWGGGPLPLVVTATARVY